ncbi:hypothetical protein JVU11DRAFT_9750 [Chiua virens]|nr:hypothetical protein JVU11DRAFT_9750 [Chiua virens]
MVLRVYAMWKQSKIILGVLLILYMAQTITAFVFAAFYDNPESYLSVTIGQISDILFCDASLSLPSPLWSYMFPNFALSTTLLILAIVQTLKESLDMYKVTNSWQLNRYMKLLVRDGILYFVTHLVYDILSTISWGDGIHATTMIFLSSISTMLLFVMLPRFIIHIREVYDRDVRVGCGMQGIDTGFGIGSQTTREDRNLSGIVFADVSMGQSHIVEGDVDISEERAPEGSGQV